MPNWCKTKLTITGPEEELDAIEKNHIGTLDDNGLNEEEVLEEEFCFGSLIPRPLEWNERWYDWNTTHWGTKWGACHSHYERLDNELLVVFFDTAWSPAVEVIEELSARYPNSTVDVLLWEEAGFYAGGMTYRQGEVTEDYVNDEHATWLDAYEEFFGHRLEDDYEDEDEVPRGVMLL